MIGRPMSAAPSTRYFPATRIHKFATGLWLVLAALMVVSNILIALIVALFPSVAWGQQSGLGAVYLFALLATIVGAFALTIRSRLEIDDRGIRVVPAFGQSTHLDWSQIRSLSIATVRPAWLLWLSQWSVVETQLTNGEAFALSPTMRHSASEAEAVREALMASAPSSSDAGVSQQRFPQVYRPSRLERVETTLFLFITAAFVLGVLVVMLGTLINGAGISFPASSPDGPPIGAYLGALIWIVLIAAYLVTRRERLVATEQGLDLFSSTGRHRTITWAAVASFAVETTYPFRTQYGAAPWQVVVANLVDGTSTALTPTERSGRTSAEVDDVRDRLSADLDLMRRSMPQSVELPPAAGTVPSPATQSPVECRLEPSVRTFGPRSAAGWPSAWGFSSSRYCSWRPEAPSLRPQVSLRFLPLMPWWE